MSNEEVIANLVGLMTTFQFEIQRLPNHLKCSECKSVLKDSHQLSCRCRFCRTCIDDMISRGDQFCPGRSYKCGGIHLSTAKRDFRSNNSILKLTAKCPHAGCPCECSLADMESHMHACLSKNISCPFRELGCAQSALPGAEITGHLLQESRSHCDILIGTVANIRMDMGMMKREQMLKDEQGKHLENEMKLIKDENESMKREKEVLCDRVRQLSKKLQREIDERHRSDERGTAMATAVTSNQEEIQPVRGDIQSIKDQFESIKCQMKSIQVLAGLEQLDEGLIEEDVAKSEWGTKEISGKFGGRPYTYQLVSRNSVDWNVLLICLRIWVGPDPSQLEWPFRGEVTVTLGHRDRREVFSRQTRQCQIEKPPANRYIDSEEFVFSHVALRGTGLDLTRGVYVSCQIVPDESQLSRLSACNSVSGFVCRIGGHGEFPQSL